MSERGCGPCTICCRFFAVPETGKPVQQWCEHCTDTGCAVHATRPQSCRNFQCFWLIDDGIPEDMRPDRCGVVVSFNEKAGNEKAGETEAERDEASVVVHVDPDRPDALAEAPGCYWVDALLGAYESIYVVCGDDRMMIRRP